MKCESEELWVHMVLEPGSLESGSEAGEWITVNKQMFDVPTDNQEK